MAASQLFSWPSLKKMFLCVCLFRDSAAFQPETKLALNIFFAVGLSPTSTRKKEKPISLLCSFGLEKKQPFKPGRLFLLFFLSAHPPSTFRQQFREPSPGLQPCVLPSIRDGVSRGQLFLCPVCMSQLFPPRLDRRGNSLLKRK